MNITVYKYKIGLRKLIKNLEKDLEKQYPKHLLSKIDQNRGILFFYSLKKKELKKLRKQLVLVMSLIIIQHNIAKINDQKKILNFFDEQDSKAHKFQNYILFWVILSFFDILKENLAKKSEKKNRNIVDYEDATHKRFSKQTTGF